MATNPQKLREELNKKKDKWMRERQAELVSKETLQELRYEAELSTTHGLMPPPSASSVPRPTPSSAYSPAPYAESTVPQPRQPPAPPGPFIAPEDVIQRLTEKISDRLRDELKLELQREAKASAATRALENEALDSHLARELESHTCPVCYELMAPPDHAPLTLFPCGHVFCLQCIKEHVDTHGRNKCPYCREKIANRAPNLPLQQLIQSFLHKRERYRGVEGPSATGGAGRGGDGGGEGARGGGPGASTSGRPPEPLAAHYERELAVKQMRCRVLRNELLDSEEELRAKSEAVAAASLVLDHMRSEREGVEQRIRQLKAELALIDDQVRGQEEKVASLSTERDHCLARIDLIGRTLTPLGAELDKIHVILQGIYNGEVTGTNINWIEETTGNQMNSPDSFDMASTPGSSIRRTPLSVTKANPFSPIDGNTPLSMRMGVTPHTTARKARDDTSFSRGMSVDDRPSPPSPSPMNQPTASLSVFNHLQLRSQRNSPAATSKPSSVPLNILEDEEVELQSGLKGSRPSPTGAGAMTQRARRARRRAALLSSSDEESGPEANPAPLSTAAPLTSSAPQATLSLEDSFEEEEEEAGGRPAVVQQTEQQRSRRRNVLLMDDSEEEEEEEGEGGRVAPSASQVARDPPLPPTRPSLRAASATMSRLQAKAAVQGYIEARSRKPFFQSSPLPQSPGQEDDSAASPSPLTNANGEGRGQRAQPRQRHRRALIESESEEEEDGGDLSDFVVADSETESMGSEGWDEGEGSEEEEVEVVGEEVQELLEEAACATARKGRAGAEEGRRMREEVDRVLRDLDSDSDAPSSPSRPPSFSFRPASPAPSLVVVIDNSPSPSAGPSKRIVAVRASPPPTTPEVEDEGKGPELRTPLDKGGRAQGRTPLSDDALDCLLARFAPPQATPAPKAPSSTPFRTPKLPAPTPLSFRRDRQRLTKALYEEFNRTVFGSRLPPDLEITWSEKLRTTAGLTHYRREALPPPAPQGPDPLFQGAGCSARVELSSKVLDSEDKLRRTLCHELCHVAAWLIDGKAKPPHGPHFKAWANRAMRVYPGLDIATCHNYEIFYAHWYECLECGQRYGRHSASIDTEAKACGRCRGRLHYTGKVQKDGTPAPKKEANGYALYVKGAYKAKLQELKDAGLPHKSTDVMRALAEAYRMQKSTPELDGGGGVA